MSSELICVIFFRNFFLTNAVNFNLSTVPTFDWTLASSAITLTVLKELDAIWRIFRFFCNHKTMQDTEPIAQLDASWAMGSVCPSVLKKTLQSTKNYLWFGVLSPSSRLCVVRKSNSALLWNIYFSHKSFFISTRNGIDWVQPLEESENYKQQHECL